MIVEEFLKAILSQNAANLRKYFHENALIKWHCTNELFTVEEYIKANCEYPGDWDGEIERIDKIDDIIIFACRIFPVDKSAFFHVVSFIQLKDGLIFKMDEYWADDGLAPEWRRRMKIGKPIR